MGKGVWLDKIERGMKMGGLLKPIDFKGGRFS